jgi:hypothetical protein
MSNKDNMYIPPPLSTATCTISDYFALIASIFICDKMTGNCCTKCVVDNTFNNLGIPAEISTLINLYTPRCSPSFLKNPILESHTPLCEFFTEYRDSTDTYVFGMHISSHPHNIAIIELYNKAYEEYIDNKNNDDNKNNTDFFIFETSLIDLSCYSHFVRTAALEIILSYKNLVFMSAKKGDNEIMIYNNMTDGDIAVKVCINSRYGLSRCDYGSIYFFNKTSRICKSLEGKIAQYIVRNIEPEIFGDTYIMSFVNDRVTVTSNKNFRVYIEHPDILTRKDMLDRTIIQLGETGGRFVVDFRYPLSPIQAFFMAISTVYCKLQ